MIPHAGRGMKRRVWYSCHVQLRMMASALPTRLPVGSRYSQGMSVRAIFGSALIQSSFNEPTLHGVKRRNFCCL